MDSMLFIIIIIIIIVTINIIFHMFAELYAHFTPLELLAVPFFCGFIFSVNLEFGQFSNGSQIVVKTG